MLIISDGKEKALHISEIGTLIIENTAVNLTAYLLCELSRYKVKIIFCDHQRNPYSEIIPYYGAHNASKQMRRQSQWPQATKDKIWQRIVAQKIIKQAQVVYRDTANQTSCEMLMNFAASVLPGDTTNREAHAAKLYFKELFGPQFSRDSSSDINAALNYGYAILLSAFNREITAAGYSTTMGVNHCNEYNPFNLTCDLMEPFRPVVDLRCINAAVLRLTTSSRAALLIYSTIKSLFLVKNSSYQTRSISTSSYFLERWKRVAKKSYLNTI